MKQPLGMKLFINLIAKMKAGNSLYAHLGVTFIRSQYTMFLFYSRPSINKSKPTHHQQPTTLVTQVRVNDILSAHSIPLLAARPHGDNRCILSMTQRQGAATRGGETAVEGVLPEPARMIASVTHVWRHSLTGPMSNRIN